MPKTNQKERELLQAAPDQCRFLTHIVRQNDGKSDRAARDIFDLILDIANGAKSPSLKASATGWYSAQRNAKGYSIAKQQVVPAQQWNAVCFTEAPLSSLKIHCDTFRAKFGVAFLRSFALEKGASPCINVNRKLFYLKVCGKEQVCHYLPEQLHPFVNVVAETFDATHEREWRHVGDFHFIVDDLALVICPRSHHDYYRDKLKCATKDLFIDLLGT